MNAGAYNHLVGRDETEPLRISLSRVSAKIPDGTRWDAPSAIVLKPAGVVNDLDRLRHPREIEISLDHNDDYRIVYMRASKQAAEQKSPAAKGTSGGIRMRKLRVPDPVRADGIDQIWIRPASRDGRYSIGHVHFIGDQAPPSAAEALRIRLSQLSQAVPGGARWNEPPAIVLKSGGIMIDLEQRRHPLVLEVSLDHNDDYQIVYLLDREQVAEQASPAARRSPGGLYVRRLRVPDPVVKVGVDQIWIRPMPGDGKYSIGHIRLVDG